MATIVWNPSQPPFSSRIPESLFVPAQPELGSSSSGNIEEPQTPGVLTTGEAEVTVTSRRGIALARIERIASFPFTIANATSGRAPGVVTTSLQTAGTMRAGIGIGRRIDSRIALTSVVVAGYSIHAVIYHQETDEKKYEFKSTDFKRLLSPTAITVGASSAGGQPVVPATTDRDPIFFLPTANSFSFL